MAVTDIASRTYNHGWRLDPIVRSLLDTDFYKLLMLQMIREFYPDQQVTFSVINRSRHVRLGEIIDEQELRAQLDHARSIRFSKKELIWLAGNTFYGKTQMFSPDFINWLATFRLPEYELRKVDGQYELHFHGPWTHTTMWEIPALAILNELRSRQAMKGQGRFVLDVLYARAKAKLWTKVERLQKLDGLRLSDFGTRRRHGFLWQRWCVEAVKEGLGSSFTGTSNVLLAMDNDLEAIGTNAHELPMVAAALADNDDELRWAPYRILDQWRHTYGGNLLIALPDAFGTKSFLRDAPEWVADWTGFRPDSAPPIAAGEEIIKWWKEKGRDPREKLLVFSDAMDVGSIEETHRHFAGRVRISFGWGTNLTNDFVGCAPDGSANLDPISIVCKVTSVDGRPAVKLSDNPEKATGNAPEIERYLRVFGSAGRVRSPGTGVIALRCADPGAVACRQLLQAICRFHCRSRLVKAPHAGQIIDRAGCTGNAGLARAFARHRREPDHEIRNQHRDRWLRARTYRVRDRSCRAGARGEKIHRRYDRGGGRRRKQPGWQQVQLHHDRRTFRSGRHSPA